MKLARQLYQLAIIRRLFASQHLNQCGLARTIRPDDADDAARGQREGEAIDEDAVAKALAQRARLCRLRPILG